MFYLLDDPQVQAGFRDAISRLVSSTVARYHQKIQSRNAALVPGWCCARPLLQPDERARRYRIDDDALVADLSGPSPRPTAAPTCCARTGEPGHLMRPPPWQENVSPGLAPSWMVPGVDGLFGLTSSRSAP